MGKLINWIEQIYTKAIYGNKLEHYIKLAAKNKLPCEKLYETLLYSDVYVLVQDVTAHKKNIILVAEHEGKRMIPVFSTPEKIKLFIKQKQQYIKIQGKEFFSLIKNTEPVVLNLGDTWSYALSIEEVARIGK